MADPTQSEILAKENSELNFVAVAPDGVTLATGSDDGTVRLWNLATRTSTGQFAAHANWVLCGAISPQGDRLATGGRDNIIRLWSLDGELKSELVGHTSTVESLAFLPDGRRLASTSTDGTVRLWDLPSGTSSIVGTLQKPAVSVASSHDGRLLATGCEDHDIYLWDVESHSLRGRLTGHIEMVQCVEFSPDDTRLASAGKDGSVRVWNIARQSQVESFARKRCTPVERRLAARWRGPSKLGRRRHGPAVAPPGQPLGHAVGEMPADVSRVFLAPNDRRGWSLSDSRSRRRTVDPICQ